MEVEKRLTPLMRQYFDIKAQYPDTVLLFQVGDFYELFFDDAKKAASILGIALTKRGTYEGEPIPLAGVPLHVVSLYVSKLVRAGFKVALCDQLEVARPGKVVDRGVTQVLTPGTLTDSALLDEKSASYLSIFFPAETSWTFLSVELLTGQLLGTLLDGTSSMYLEAELHRFMPDEVLLPQTKQGLSFDIFFKQQGYTLSHEPFDLHRDKAEVMAWLGKQFPQQVDLAQKSEGLCSALILLYTYLKRNNEVALGALKQFAIYKPEDYVLLDAGTQRNLELTKNFQDGSQSFTLFSVLDRAVTPMGSRLIKRWVVRPLLKKAAIEQRLEAVQVFFSDRAVKSELRKLFRLVGDLERVVGRLALRRSGMHDYRALIAALTVVPVVKNQLEGKDATLLISLVGKIGDFQKLETFLNAAINTDESKDWLVKRGFNKELDRLRSLVETGAQSLIALEKKEQESTGIASLKVRYNQVHGYGIEVTNTNKHLIPSHYIRTQTLANRERYTTQELKDLEHDLHRARSEITQHEKAVFDGIKIEVEQFVPSLKKLSYALASLDALASLAEVAYVQGYVRPDFNEEGAISIEQGRHPVVELRLQERFIPNETKLSKQETLWLITGPNMGGKSTFLRQVALIVLMAQIGSFVPAKRASISLVDRIFTRIGASDNVAEGKSTFLVEMEETALICNRATQQSLVILDEVGRGTSTFDGLAIAQAVVEYISQIGAPCLFATHYHELTALSDTFPCIRSYYAASTKTDQGIVLLHKIMPGIADGSFGLEVALLAELPAPLIERARAILKQLTYAPQSHPVPKEYDGLYQRKQELETLLAQREKESRWERALAQEVADLDCEQLTPKQALDILWRLQELRQK